MTLKVNVERAQVAAERLFHAFQGAGPGVFGTREMPEDAAPKTVEPGSEDHLRFLTFTVSIDYQRPAAQLWEASRLAFETPAGRSLFDPMQVVGMPVELLEGSLKSLKVSRKYGPDAKTWLAVASVLQDHFDGKVSNLVETCDFDASLILQTIREGTTRIRFLSGKKIGPLWLRMLHDNGGVRLKGMNDLPIPVDVHIARSTLAIGAIEADGPLDSEQLRVAIQSVWEDACRDKPYYALRLDEPLWQQSRLGCTNRTSTSCAMREECIVSDLCVRGRISLTTSGADVATSPLRQMF